MVLKTLQLKGFKSFANKTTIHFDGGITGIIGPNGSGKSNLTEAIRWVMGEQSPKSLRGDNMQDVIFGGSDARPPLNQAEVVLQFDNRDRQLKYDHDEVQITRRLFRTGESDFLINNHKVRLKDIVSLFLDSGLGKHSMAIISQGNVEAIFNSKPKDRRFIIEQPAGVAGFKEKKKQAQQQLEQTDDNLKRVSDIVHELARQVEPLKEQASIAHDYQEQKGQFEQIDQHILAVEIEQLNRKKVQGRQKKQEIQQQLQSVEQKLQDANQQVRQNHQDSQQITEQIDQGQTQLTTLSSQLEIAKGQQAVKVERSTNQDEHERNLRQQQSKLQFQLATQTQKINRQIQQVHDLDLRLQQVQSALTEQQQSLKQNSPDAAVSLADLQEQRVRLLQEHSVAQSQLDDQQQQLLKLHQQLPRANSELIQQQKLCQKVQQQQVQCQKLLTEQQTKGCHQRDILQQLQTKQQQLQTSLQQAQHDYYQQLRLVQQNQANLKSLQHLISQHQGFYKGVRAVLNADLSGIIGAVAELIQVPQQYQTALQSASGAQLQSIVTTDQQAARMAIQYLRQHHQGRATFLPQTVMQSRKLTPQQLAPLIEDPAFLGLASELIQIDSKLQNIADNLFGNLLVFQDLPTAIAAGNRLSHRYRIVTLAGDVMNPGGSMTGGQNHGGSDVLGQNAQVKHLKEQLQNSQTQLDHLQQRIQQLEQQKQQNQVAVTAQNDHMQALVQEVQQQQSQVQLQKQKVELQTTNLDQLQRKYLELQQQEEQVTQTRKQLQQNCQQLTQHLTDLQRQIQQQQTFRTDYDAQKTKIEQRIQSLSTELALAKNNCQNQQQQLQQLQNQHRARQTELDQVNQELDHLSSAQNNFTKEEQTLKASIDDLMAQLTVLQQRLPQLQTKRQQLQQEAQNLEPVASRLFALQRDWLDQQEQVVVQLSDLNTQLKQCLERLEQEYHLSFEAAMQQLPDNFQLTVAQDQAHLLQKGLSELGPVNLASITEYDQVKDRYTFLTQQRDDLVTARTQLQATMSEMDQEVSTRFSEMFTKVAQAFVDIFPTIFGGGHAKLVLTEPDNLLESGIEIIAQPPGKKLQRMSLLSGGERALTAITLLFAILQVKPVPFCVLDEVEASLDDVNVARFADFLQAYDQKTQFIIITHRKGTMLRVERLYGVTMQESGISKILTVDLKKEVADNHESI
ncbi:chromosome segregation protein SMC [Bombilactobacillus folatiphilus]|uniref:Chromosome partition protein Smc n=1 Tax=Bombilactobacillus folatiphilus TaxID=2923362 RepID=A0ABY4P7C7_9LACO|nr:chromosome segregation protein SMC [Bombilactobacillus folatiphilus]UQS81605.1 chromosome segregation protein SMC [Bombilactobacillus folatiphilus]